MANRTNGGFAAVPNDTTTRLLAEMPVFEPDEALQFMNVVQKHAVIVNGGKTLIVTRGHDLVLDRPTLSYSSAGDIKLRYQNRRVKVERTAADGTVAVEHVPLAKWWLQSFDRQEYLGVVFDPHGEERYRKYLNLWSGFGVDPRPGDWSLLKAHIYNVLCRRNPAVNTWLLDWLADSVQWPANVPETAIVLLGGEGFGKGILARQWCGLFGLHQLQITHTAHLTGKFNPHLQNVVAVFFDEAFSSDDRNASSVLKALITEPTFIMEPKHRDVSTVKNVAHIIIASNELKAITAGRDARRFQVLDVSDERRGDHDYFAAIIDQQNNGGREAMLYELQRREITSELRQPIPTEALLDQKIRSMDAGHTWWFERLQDGKVLPGDTDWRTEVLRHLLSESYSEAIGRNGNGHARATELGLLLRSVLPAGFPRCSQRTVQPDDLPHSVLRVEGVKRFWQFPDLLTCRRHFEDKLVRQPIRWGE
jgi:Mesyanzhinovviridae DNA primase